MFLVFLIASSVSAAPQYATDNVGVDISLTVGEIENFYFRENTSEAWQSINITMTTSFTASSIISNSSQETSTVIVSANITGEQNGTLIKILANDFDPRYE